MYSSHSYTLFEVCQHCLQYKRQQGVRKTAAHCRTLARSQFPLPHSAHWLSPVSKMATPFE
jgi:hypothetical protein